MFRIPRNTSSPPASAPSPTVHSSGSKLTSAQRLRRIQQENALRLKKRQEKEKEKAAACAENEVLRRRNLNLASSIFDLTRDSDSPCQRRTNETNNELVSDDDEDEQGSMPCATYTETSHPASKVVVLSEDEQAAQPKLKRRKPGIARRVSLPINNSVFAPNPLRERIRRNKSTRANVVQKVAKRTRHSPLREISQQNISSRNDTYDSDLDMELVVMPPSPRSKQLKRPVSRPLPPCPVTRRVLNLQISDDKQPEYMASKKQEGTVKRQQQATDNNNSCIKSGTEAISSKKFYGGNNGVNETVVMEVTETTSAILKKGAALKSNSPRIDQCGEIFTGTKPIGTCRKQRPRRRIVRNCDEEVDEICEMDIRFKALNEEEVKQLKCLTYKVPKQQVMAFIKAANIKLKADDFSGLRGSRWLNDEVINSFTALLNERNKKHVSSCMKDKINSANKEDDEVMEVAITGGNPMQVFHLARPRVHIFNTFFFERLSRGKYDYNGVKRWLKRANQEVCRLDLIMFPINVRNFHWVLAAIDLRGKQFVYLDSTYGEDTGDALSILRKWLFDEVADKQGMDAARNMKIDEWGCVMNPSYVPCQKDGGSCGVFTLYLAEYLERGKQPNFTQENIRTLRQRTALFLKSGSLPET